MSNLKIKKISSSKLFVFLKSKLNLFIYALILVLMNFIRVFDNSFWGDEGYSIMLAKMSVADMITTTANDVHPPLYYLLVQLLYHIFGNNGVAYHLSGFLPYLVIMIVGCTSVKKYFGRIPETILITLSSIMSNCLTYNIEARMYSLAAMFILISYIAYYKILKCNRLLNWFIFVISSLGAAYTHYYALLSVTFLYMMLLPLATKVKNYRKGIILSYIITIICYLPWLIILINAFTRTANSWWLDYIPSIRSCVKFLLDNIYIVLISAFVILLYLLYQSNVLNLTLSKEEKKMNIQLDISNIKMSNDLYWILSGLISIAGTVLIGLILSYAIRPFLVTRYIFPLSAILYLIIGFSISKLKFSKTWATLFVLLILCTHIPTYISTYKEGKSFDQGTSNFLENVQPEASEKIISNNKHLTWTLLDYYYPENVGEYNTEAITNLNIDEDIVWLFWTEELDEFDIESLNKQNYKVEKIYESNFANTYYYSYKLSCIN